MGGSSDSVYEAVKDGAMWSGGRYAGPVSGYGGLRVVREPGGKIVCGSTGGGQAVVPGGGAVAQRNLLGFVADYSPRGKLYILIMHEEMGSPNDRHPVRLWSKRGGTWQSELVIASTFADTALGLRFRPDGTPEVLATSFKSLSIYRRVLDQWKATPLYTGPSTHFGGLTVHNQADGTSHVFAGTKNFMREPSTGELILDYLRLAADGTVARQERIPVGGYTFVLVDTDQDLMGNAYALVRGQVQADRYPTHLVKVTPGQVLTSVVTNFEKTTTARACRLDGRPGAHRRDHRVPEAGARAHAHAAVTARSSPSGSSTWT